MIGGIDLNPKMKECKEQNMGRLPAMAPLANPYVPFQQDDPPKYEAKKVIVRGKTDNEYMVVDVKEWVETDDLLNGKTTY